ncbi:DUF4326 domain-containing protein [Microbispora sp. CA-102843]|uniref:DUF4326 domain-containing protein n=1 Tax=Microbispora sp. CA-102843 TaxID=3239952 RepID=UPI003D90E1BE
MPTAEQGPAEQQLAAVPVLPGIEDLGPVRPPQDPRPAPRRRARPEPLPELLWAGLTALPGMEHLGPSPRAPQRLQRRRVAGWKAPRGAVIVDRTTAYGNPWRIAGDDRRGWRVFRLVDGAETGLTLCTSEAEARALAVDRYRAYLTDERPDLIERARTELAGCDLLCPCRPGAACHADVLLDAAAGRPITPRRREDLAS